MTCDLDLDLFVTGVLENTAPPVRVNLADYDRTVVWSSGGKDSEVALDEVVEEHLRQGVSLGNILVAHNNLGPDVEWHGTLDLAWRQAQRSGLRFAAIRRSDGKLLIDHVAEKGMWPDGKRRWCTSDHKRGPGMTLLTRVVNQLGLGRTARLLQVYGFRAAESASRAAKVKVPLVFNRAASSKGDKRAKVREVWDWYPIHNWSNQQVWQRIHAARLPYHFAYVRGMRRLSCTFCVLAGEEDLVTAARLQPAKAARYLQVELEAGHSFKESLSMRQIVAKAGWDEDYLMAILAGKAHPPVCLACAAELGGADPAQLHDVPDDVATAMFGRGVLLCNGSYYLDAELLCPVSPFAQMKADDDSGL